MIRQQMWSISSKRFCREVHVIQGSQTAHRVEACRLKLFPEATDVTLSKQWAKSVIDIQGEVLCGTMVGNNGPCELS